MCKSIYKLFSIVMISLISLLFINAAYASPWQGEYEGSVSGTGNFPVFLVSATWKLIVDEDGNADFSMKDVPFVDEVSSTGNVTDDGTIYMECYVPFVGNNILTGTYADGTFTAKMEKSMKAEFDWVLNEDGSVEGHWAFDKIPVYFYSWSGSGTIAGQKTDQNDQPNPWAGHYTGTVSGEGSPIVETISGEWDLVVTDDGQVDYKMNGIPFIKTMEATGSISHDGKISLQMYVPFIGKNALTGEHLGENEFDAQIDDKIKASFHWTLDANGNVEGTWAFDKIPIFFAKWHGNGTMEGTKAETPDDDNAPIPWVGHYKGSLEGSGKPFVTDVSGAWDLVVNEDGSVLFEMSGLPFVNKVLATGTVNSKGKFSLDMYIPFIGDSNVSGTHNGGTSFSATMDDKIKAVFNWNLFEDGTTDGTWEFIKLPVFFINWHGSGTMTGSKFEPDPGFPWAGHYTGSVNGTGRPVVRKVSGEYDIYIDTEGNVDFEITGMPFINKVTASGTVSPDGDVELHMYVPGIGNNVLTGTHDGSGNFVVETDDKIKAKLEWYLSPEGDADGTWAFDRIPVLFVKWKGSGELKGSKVEDFEI